MSDEKTLPHLSSSLSPSPADSDQPKISNYRHKNSTFKLTHNQLTTISDSKLIATTYKPTPKRPITAYKPTPKPGTTTNEARPKSLTTSYKPNLEPPTTTYNATPEPFTVNYEPTSKLHTTYEPTSEHSTIIYKLTPEHLPTTNEPTPDPLKFNDSPTKNQIAAHPLPLLHQNKPIESSQSHTDSPYLKSSQSSIKTPISPPGRYSSHERASFSLNYKKSLAPKIEVYPAQVVASPTLAHQIEKAAHAVHPLHHVEEDTNHQRDANVSQQTLSIPGNKISRSQSTIFTFAQNLESTTNCSLSKVTVPANTHISSKLVPSISTHLSKNDNKPINTSPDDTNKMTPPHHRVRKYQSSLFYFSKKVTNAKTGLEVHKRARRTGIPLPTNKKSNIPRPQRVPHPPQNIEASAFKQQVSITSLLKNKETTTPYKHKEFTRTQQNAKSAPKKTGSKTSPTADTQANERANIYSTTQSTSEGRSPSHAPKTYKSTCRTPIPQKVKSNVKINNNAWKKSKTKINGRSPACAPPLKASFRAPTSSKCIIKQTPTNTPLKRKIFPVILSTNGQTHDNLPIIKVQNAINRRKPKTDKTAVLKIGQKTNKTMSTTERNIIKPDNTKNSSHSGKLNKETNKLIKKLSPARLVLNISEVQSPPRVHEAPEENLATKIKLETKQTDINATPPTKDKLTNTVDKLTSLVINNSKGRSPPCARAAQGIKIITENNLETKQTDLNATSLTKDILTITIEKPTSSMINNSEERRPPCAPAAPRASLMTERIPDMKHKHLNAPPPTRDFVTNTINKPTSFVMNNYVGRSPPCARVVPGTNFITKINPIMQHSKIKNLTNTHAETNDDILLCLSTNMPQRTSIDTFPPPSREIIPSQSPIQNERSKNIRFPTTPSEVLKAKTPTSYTHKIHKTEGTELKPEDKIMRRILLDIVKQQTNTNKRSTSNTHATKPHITNADLNKPKTDSLNERARESSQPTEGKLIIKDKLIYSNNKGPKKKTQSLIKDFIKTESPKNNPSPTESATMGLPSQENSKKCASDNNIKAKDKKELEAFQNNCKNEITPNKQIQPLLDVVSPARADIIGQIQPQRTLDNKIKIMKHLNILTTNTSKNKLEGKISEKNPINSHQPKIRTLEITQINLQHAHEPSLTLKKNIDFSLDLSIPHAICVQEPLCNTSNNNPKDIPETYFCFNLPSDKTAPRAAIYASKLLYENCLPHIELSDRDTYTISIKDPTNINKRLFICSAYLPYEEKIKNGKFIETIKKANQSKQGLIICADTNSQSRQWGNKITNSRGHQLEEIIDEYDLSLKNDLESSTWIARGSSSTIDLTLTNIYAPHIPNWQCFQNSSASDHQYIQLSTSTEIEPDSKKQKYNIKKCDWTTYKETLDQSELHPALNIIPKDKCKLDHNTDALTKIMKDALGKSCPKIKIKIHPKKKNSVIFTALERLILRKRKKTSSEEKENRKTKNQLKNEYRRGKRNFTKLIKKAREKAWKKYVTKIESTQETARITKILNKTNISPLGTLKDKNGKITQTPTETLNVLADDLLGKEVPPRPNQKMEKNLNIDDIKKFITPQRLKKAINQLKKNKTPGHDGIVNEMIINCPNKIQDCILKIFIGSIYHEHIPTSWQIANSAILAKPGKGDYATAKSYRIISLTSNLLKLLETLILWHLQEDLKIEQALNPNQYGFRSGHSTEAIITKVVNKIQTALKHGDHALGIFLDIQGAFDNLPSKSIKEELDKTAAKGKISNWITNMVSNRYITLQLANEKILRLIPKGCPQGGVLSPFLWNLVVNDLLNSFEGLENLLAYADDLLILQTGSDRDTIMETSLRYLNKIISWCKSKGLEISTVKTQIIFWTRNKKVKTPKNIKVNDTTIEIGNTAKYLGVILDDKLNWNEHINTQIKKCKNLFFACRKAIGKNWGLSATVILWIYNAIIIPKICYASSAWGMATNKTQTKN